MTQWQKTYEIINSNLHLAVVLQSFHLVNILYYNIHVS